MAESGSITGKSSKQLFLLIALLAICFVIVRMWTLFFSIDTFHEGELYRGTIAKEILEGRSWPLMLYQNEPHEGGSLIIGIIVSGLFILFGQSLLVLKSASLIITFLSFTFMLKFMYQYFDYNATLLSGLIFVFSLPLLLIHSVITMGDYHELVTIELLLILLFLRISFIRSNKDFLEPRERFSAKEHLFTALFGLLNGIGLYFSYAHAIFLCMFVLFWIIYLRKYFSVRLIAIFICSFSLGFLPWLLYNFYTGFKGLYIHQGALGRHLNVGLFFSRLKYLFSTYLPGAFSVGISFKIAGILSYLFSMGVFGIFAYVSLRDTFKEKKPQFTADLFLLCFTATYIFFYCITDFRSSPFEDYTPYKYLLLFLPFLLMIIASVLSKLARINKKPVSYLISISLIIILLPSFVFLFDLSTKKLNKYLFYYRPYSYELMGCNVVKFEEDPMKRIGFINKIKNRYRDYAYQGFGNVFSDDFSRKPDLYKDNFFSRIDQRFSHLFYRGLCVGLGERHSRKPFSIDEGLIGRIDPINRAYCYEGLGVSAAIDFVKAQDPEGISKQIKHVETKYLPYFCKGIGIGLMEVNGYNIPKATTCLTMVDEQYKSYCLSGMQEGVYFKEYKIKELLANRDYLYP